MVAPQINTAAITTSAPPVQKVSRLRREITLLASRNRRNDEQDFRHGEMGAIMTIAEYLAASALTILIVWAVLGLLMQES